MQGLRRIWLGGLALFLDPFCKERGLIMHDCSNPGASIGVCVIRCCSSTSSYQSKVAPGCIPLYPDPLSRKLSGMKIRDAIAKF